MKRSPYFDRWTRSTHHSDYLDSVALFKLGQIDLRQLETALNVFNESGLKFVSPKVLKKINHQDFIPVVQSTKPESSQKEELKVVEEDSQPDLKAIPIYPFSTRPGLTYGETVMEKKEYYKHKHTIEIENKRRYEVRNVGKQ